MRYSLRTLLHCLGGGLIATLALFAAVRGTNPEFCRLTIRLTDAATGAPVPGLIRV